METLNVIFVKRKVVVLSYHDSYPHISGYSLESCSSAELSSALPDKTKQRRKLELYKYDI